MPRCRVRAASYTGVDLDDACMFLLLLCTTVLHGVHEVYTKKVEVCCTWTTKNSARSCSDERSDYTHAPTEEVVDLLRDTDLYEYVKHVQPMYHPALLARSLQQSWVSTDQINGKPKNKKSVLPPLLPHLQPVDTAVRVQ